MRLTALLLAALAASAAARSAPPLPGLPNPDLMGREADYAGLSHLVASVLLLREGGVDAALDTIPLLHDETHAYVQATSLLAANPQWGWNTSDWAGISAKANAALAAKATLKNVTVPGGKNLTANDPLQAWGDAVAAKLNATGKLAWDPTTDPKVNATTAKLNALGDKLFGGKNETQWMDSLNAKLAQYNIKVTGKSIAQPSKFANGAATIARSITGLSLAAFGVNFAPCLVSWSNTGLLAGVTGINIQPEGLVLATRGVSRLGVVGKQQRDRSFSFTTIPHPTHPPPLSFQAAILPTAINLQPGLILINPVGYSVQPQGMQVAPFLIAVAPLGDNVQPQGFNVAPNDIAVVPTGKAISPGGLSISPVGESYAPTDIDLAKGAPSDDVPIAGKRRLLSAPGMPHPIEIMDDPLDLSNDMPHDYRNWAAVLSQVLLQKEGDGVKASDALGRVMLDAHGHLAALANGEEFVPKFHLNDPSFLGSLMDGKGVGAPPASLTKFATAGSFINFSPCVLSESATGAGKKGERELKGGGEWLVFYFFRSPTLPPTTLNTDISAVGLNIIPRLISIRTTLADVEGAFFNFQPQLIYINNIGLSVQPQGFSVQPGLIYVGAIGANVQPQGANIQPQGITIAPVGSNVQPQGAVIAPVRKLIAPTHIAYTPKKKSIGDTAIDLTDPKVLASLPAGGKKQG